MNILPVQRCWLAIFLQVGTILTITAIGTIGISISGLEVQRVVSHTPALITYVQCFVVVLLTAFILFGGCTVLTLVGDSCIQFTSLGVQRPFWYRPSFIPWTLIQALIYADDRIVVVTPRQRIQIRAGVFAHPSELVARLQPYLLGTGHQHTSM